MAASKGPSNLYGNGGNPSKHISYEYAKYFNSETLYDHVNNHKKETGSHSMKSYEEAAMRFANRVNRLTNDSFIDKGGTTYKYSYLTKEFAVIKNNGTIVTYFKPKNPDIYWEGVKRKYGKK